MVRKHKMANCYIPFEIQEDIMKRLPIKSLIRFRSVSKPWKSLIDSSKFIIDHTSHHDHPQYMLIRYDDPRDNFKGKYVSIVDNNTFPQHQIPLIVPVSVTRLEYPRIGGYDQGLFCFYSTYMYKATIWNPTIRKSVDIDVPNLSHRRHYCHTFISFGVSPETMDPKLVKITYISYYQSHHEKISSIPRQVEVFTLSTRVWRSLSINLPRLSIGFIQNSQVVIDGLIYWVAHANVEYYRLIMSFDLKSEEFTEIYLPSRLAIHHDITLSKLRDSLVVLINSRKAHQRFYGVWVMENGIPKSFKKLFNIKKSTGWIDKVLGFRKSGEPIIQIVANKDYKNTSLCVYVPYSQHVDNIGIYGMAYKFFVCSYMETLLLLDQ